MPKTRIRFACFLFLLCCGYVFFNQTAFAQFVMRNPKTSQGYLDGSGRTLQVRGLNRFAIYESKDNRDDLSVEDYFSFIKSKGFNLVRVFVREGYVIEGRRLSLEPIEPELGVYSVNHLNELKSVFKEASKHGIYIMLCLYDHYYLHHAWKKDPNSGDVQVSRPTPYFQEGTISDFFYESPYLRHFQKERIRFLVNQFKNEPYLFAWEPMNEVNGVLKDSYQKENQIVTDWFNDMAKLIKEEDPNHMVALSLTGDLFWSPLGNYFPWSNLYQSPWVDIIQVHSYAFDGTWRTYLEEGYRRSISEAKKFGKAVMVGEFGVKEENKRWYFLTKRAFEIAKEEAVPALIWTHRYDPYGGLSDQKIEIYHSVYPDMMEKK